jgi:hypothetical protein
VIQQDHSSPLQSPWQTPTKQPGSIRRESMVGSDLVKTVQKPSMTLWKTVAGTPPAKTNAGPNTPQGPASSVPNAPLFIGYSPREIMSMYVGEGIAIQGSTK